MVILLYEFKFGIEDKKEMDSDLIAERKEL